MIVRLCSSMVTSSVTVIAAGSRRVDRHLGDLEVLQVHSVGRHPCCAQCGLHDVHERAWPADVIVGGGNVFGMRNECVDVRRRHEAAFVVEMMVYDKTARVAVVQGCQRFVEDHRVTAAVGVEQPGVARAGYQR